MCKGVVYSGVLCIRSIYCVGPGTTPCRPLLNCYPQRIDRQDSSGPSKKVAPRRWAVDVAYAHLLLSLAAAAVRARSHGHTQTFLKENILGLLMQLCLLGYQGRVVWMRFWRPLDNLFVAQMGRYHEK